MYMIEIAALDNGAHRNQTCNGFLPDGWALVPANLETKNFPFGEITVEDMDGRMVVATWTPLPMPEPEPAPVPDPGPTLDERVQTLEDSSAEMSEALDLLLSGVTE